MDITPLEPHHHAIILFLVWSYCQLSKEFSLVIFNIMLSHSYNFQHYALSLSLAYIINFKLLKLEETRVSGSATTSVIQQLTVVLMTDN